MFFQSQKTVFGNAKEFKDMTEAQNFCKEYYFDYVKSLDQQTKNMIMYFQSSGRSEKEDMEIIHSTREAFKYFPPVPFDYIAYRGGDMLMQDRPIVSSSFSRNVALNFAGKESKLHCILIRKGAIFNAVLIESAEHVDYYALY